MSTHREAQFNQEVLIDPTPLPSSIPHVDEVGATSAPLKSASFTIGGRCREYMDDFMACKRDFGSRGEDAEFECLSSGRKVTRCATETLSFINTHCGREFKLHWNCLESKNHEFANCRPAERHLNRCIFDSMGVAKHVPGTKEGLEPWLKAKPIFRPFGEDPASVAFEPSKTTSKASS